MSAPPDPEPEGPRGREAAEARLERMCVADLLQVLDIARRCFASPWSLSTCLAELRSPLACCQVARLGSRVVAYCFSWTLGREVHIDAVAAHPGYRRRGLSERLLRAALARGARAGGQVTLLEVGASNAAALALYRKLGFTVVGCRRGYYGETGEDALLLARRVGEDGRPGRGAGLAAGREGGSGIGDPLR